MTGWLRRSRRCRATVALSRRDKLPLPVTGATGLLALSAPHCRGWMRRTNRAACFTCSHVRHSTAPLSISPERRSISAAHSLTVGSDIGGSHAARRVAARSSRSSSGNANASCRMFCECGLIGATVVRQGRSLENVRAYTASARRSICKRVPPRPPVAADWQSALPGSPHAPHVAHDQNTTGPSYLRAGPLTSSRIAQPLGLNSRTRTRSVRTTGMPCPPGALVQSPTCSSV